MKGVAEEPVAAASVKPLVLIADGDAVRSRRLAVACERSGLSCRTGAHGVAALELALSERPGIVVAQVDLPLVAAPKLAEILRVNPRTRASRFLFLGETPPGLVGPDDRELPEAAETAVIVEAIQELIGCQEPLDAGQRAALGETPMDGSLEFVSLADLLLLFHAHGVSGRLFLQRVTESHECEAQGSGTLLLRDGSVLQAECGSAAGEKALFRMLGWRYGRFDFEPGAEGASASILGSTPVLVREGMRQLEAWKRSFCELPDLGARVRVRAIRGAVPTLVDPLTQEVLLALDLASTVGEVLDRCSAPDYRVLRALQTLVERQLVELVEAADGLGAARPGEGSLLDVAQLQRLREQVGADGEVRQGPPPAKLLVTSAEPGALQDFVRLVGRLPGASLAPSVLAGQLDLERLTPIGELGFEGGLRVELIYLPRAESFAPVWEQAASGGLATLFLLDDCDSQASRELRLMFERVSEVPGARAFRVGLRRKADPTGRESLGQPAEEVDDCSLFLLPLESGESAVSLLRGLFSRILR